MNSIKPSPGDCLFDVLQEAVSKAPCKFDFNGWAFETRAGESLGAARARFQAEHGFEVRTREEMAQDAAERLERTKREQAEAIAKAGAATEAEMRKMIAPHLDTPEQLTDYIKSLVERPHDYGTCVYAMSLAATAAFYYVSRKLGVTGFQAGCADMDILRQTRSFKWGRILDYDNLLYPQYCDDEHFPPVSKLLAEPEVRKKLATEARQLLAKEGDAHPSVKAHWKQLAEA